MARKKKSRDVDIRYVFLGGEKDDFRRRHKEAGREYQISLGGFLVWVYTSGVLCSHIDRSDVTLRRWRSKGIVPQPILKRSEDNKCRYLAEEILIYESLVKNSGIQAGCKIEGDFQARLKAEIEVLRRKLTQALREGRDPNTVMDPSRLETDEDGYSQTFP